MTLAVSELSVNDIWLHVTTGALILDEGRVPRIDSYSFTAAGRPYMAHEWIAAVFFHLIHARWGVSGLILAGALVVALMALLLALAAGAGGASLAVTLPSLALGLWISASRFWVRPHVFSWLFTAIYLWALFHYLRGPRRAVILLLLLPIQIVWANTHAGGILGLLVLGLLTLGEGLDGLRESLSAAAARARVPALATIAAALATMINPWGPRILSFPFELTSMRLYMERIYEWQPPWHPSFNGSPMLAAWMALSCALLTALFAARPQATGPRSGTPARVLAGRLLTASPALIFSIYAGLRIAGPPVWGPIPAAILIASLPLLLCAFAMIHWRAVEPVPTLLALAFMLLALRHNRSVADSALVGSVVLAGALSRLPRHRTGRSPEQLGGPGTPGEGSRLLRESRARVFVVSGLLVAAAGGVVALGYPLSFVGSTRPFSLGLGRETPACAADYVARSGLSGNAFVSYAWGAMLVHRAFPRVKVSIDSRNDVYGEEIYRAQLEALAAPASMERYLAEHRVDLVVLSYADPGPAVSRWLITSPAWAPVFLDDKGFVLARRSTTPSGLVERDEYRLLRPAALGSTRVTPASAVTALAEADRAIAACPASYFGWFYRAKALLALGLVREAIETSRRATEIDPANPAAWADLGYAWAAAGNREKAADNYQRALELDPDNRAARENLSRLGVP